MQSACQRNLLDEDRCKREPCAAGTNLPNEDCLPIVGLALPVFGTNCRRRPFMKTKIRSGDVSAPAVERAAVAAFRKCPVAPCHAPGARGRFRRDVSK